MLWKRFSDYVEPGIIMTKTSNELDNEWVEQMRNARYVRYLKPEFDGSEPIYKGTIAWLRELTPTEDGEKHGEKAGTLWIKASLMKQGLTMKGEGPAYSFREMLESVSSIEDHIRTIDQLGSQIKTGDLIETIEKIKVRALGVSETSTMLPKGTLIMVGSVTAVDDAGIKNKISDSGCDDTLNDVIVKGLADGSPVSFTIQRAAEHLNFVVRSRADDEVEP